MLKSFRLFDVTNCSLPSFTFESWRHLSDGPAVFLSNEGAASLSIRGALGQILNNNNLGEIFSVETLSFARAVVSSHAVTLFANRGCRAACATLRFGSAGACEFFRCHGSFMARAMSKDTSCPRNNDVFHSPFFYKSKRTNPPAP
jgi:hypothetical protein